MTDSTENTPPLKSTKSRNSNFSVQLEIKPKSPFEFVPQDDEKFEFFDLEGFGGVAFSVETVMEQLNRALVLQCVDSVVVC